MKKNNERKDNRRKPKEEVVSEYEEKVVFVNRCAKVLKGGRKFSFSALIVSGNGKGKVGYGFAKANELTDAIRKAREASLKDIITFEQNGTTIPHEIIAKQDGARLMMKPAPEGTGVVAGSMVRSVLELAGIEDVVAKNLGSNNPVNQVRATFKALKALRNPEKVQALRG
ncbi:MAG: 30S ribosomal protein S5 [Waddliaceae bacterium]|jgi:small subunit ribosomal protein S5|nr:30S ribosomal protein S5 [Waddliaceae bacterium]MBT3578644.1 30S ribosomal protein S5 [Waddliaceae bacterium]MBT4445363.1 30S ribosomal protein S5 [Waddliaceae bacterium]MBT6928369.1 30S ribosomal protein S5 [Waddliaceae bacterium]MBT7265055.1 30S ribosomal protein S5 [Waddliaceae bacterium]